MTLYAYQKHSLVRADHPDNMKRGGVCIYYKESLPVRLTIFDRSSSLRNE